MTNARCRIATVAAGTALFVASLFGPSPTPPAGASTGSGAVSFLLTLANGAVYDYGGAQYFGSPADHPLTRPIVGVTETADAGGYWMVASDGGVFNYGDAGFFGSTGALALNKPVVGLTPTPHGKGYWLVASDGGIFTFGDAGFFGSTGAVALNRPIVGLAATPDGLGYWLVASDGGIFSFGDATFSGSTGALALNQPIVAVAPSPDGKGYWLLATDGGIFAFGNAAYLGSTGSAPGEPAQRIVPTKSGLGYWIVEQNGTAPGFGDALGALPPPQALLFTPHSPGERAVAWAFTQLGKPYIWGGNGPIGYDCSGLALTAWRTAANVTFARVANDQYHTAGTSVALGDLMPGDLVFWGHDQSDWISVYHVALYVGGGRIVEATGDHVQLNSLDQWGASDLMANGRRPCPPGLVRARRRCRPARPSGPGSPGWPAGRPRR